MLKRVLYSHCVWPSPGLVNADERRESQDQVPAGQQDFSASCTSIRSGVGCCKQQSRDTRWLADSPSLLAASHSLSQAVPPPFSYERSSRCLPSRSQIKTHDGLARRKESFNKTPCFKPVVGTSKLEGITIRLKDVIMLLSLLLPLNLLERIKYISSLMKIYLHKTF